MKRTYRDLPAQLTLLCLLALAVPGCQRSASQSAEPPAQPAQPEPPRVAPAQPAPAPTAVPVQSAPAPTITESRDVEQPPRTVEPPVRPAPPTPPAPLAPLAPKPDRERRLESRERRLAERQAALDAREKQLRQQEQEAQPPNPAAGEPAPDLPAAETAPEPAPEPQPEPRLQPVTVEAGTKLDIKLTRSLSSETSAAGEIFRARIDQDIYAGDRLAIPAGSEVVGEVTQAVPGKKIGGKAVLELRLTDLVLPSGETVPLKASFQQAGPSRTGRDAATIGGATAGGAILGRILGNGGGKGTVIGAIVGAVAGSVIASRHPGEPVVIPEGTVLGIVLDRPIEVQSRR